MTFAASEEHNRPEDWTNQGTESLVNDNERSSQSAPIANPGNQIWTTTTTTTAQTKSKSRKDLWTLIKESKEREKKTNEVDAVLETTVYVVGSKGSGKSSMILRFLDRDETPSPSVALEYTFGRRTRGVNSVKDITHIWELAGGVCLSDLLDISVTEANIHVSSFLIVLDLSNPEGIIEVLESLLERIREKTSKILDGLEQRGSKRPKALRSYAMKQYGLDHPDRDIVTLSHVPITIVGSKYDEIHDMESEMRKMLCKMLRYMAHTNGASLVYVSQKDEALVSRSRQIWSHHAFRSNAPKSIVVDHHKPILVMAGQDTFSDIGLPPSELAKDIVGRRAFIPLDKWKLDYAVFFPKPPSQAVLEKVDLSKFSEPSVDAMRAQKEEELERLRRENDRRLKDKSVADSISNSMHTGTRKDLKKPNRSYSRAKASQMGVS
ncbi:hypothetical protein BASA50_002914 [Batrachochytrium salamandrivorans]|uniref:Cytoplasmic dynein 2 light intermediate chain 1 n=1 Tax=Batrachochytrium salamandrivorans TaxID=1357716 RepID=A0ABQ8FJW0_9FUNG|nr:hypothetical protein BASA61_005662 [Batrachochytrium salamandrivorans]KAH6599572.1 hypothetical protein BASA50_002914 [Batrachochytrium salamandrivorans]KAH9267976.1 hypothetical protein BASA84_000441 [Batrachochytrium salamandrivorans]